MIYNFIIKNIFIIIIIFIIILTLIIIEIKDYQYKKNGLTPQEAIKLFNNNNAIIIDLREENIFNKSYILNSINIPYNKINEYKNTIIRHKKNLIILIENKKNNKEAINLLKSYGCNNITYIIDGIESWQKNDLPTYKKEQK
jgi:rhodanese-related sulfurtransferase